MKKYILYNRKSYRKNRAKVIAATSAYSKKVGWKYQKAWIAKHSDRSRYHILKHRLKNRSDVPICSVDEFSLWYLAQDKVCFYCGISQERLSQYSKQPDRWLAIDRLIPDKGYVVGNMVLCCRKCNCVKCDVLTPDEMKQVAKMFVIHKSLN